MNTMSNYFKGGKRNMKNVEDMKAEIMRLKDENELIRVSLKEVDRICEKLIIAMQCVVIEFEHGEGANAGISWIYNTLFDRGELPPESETNAKNYADREYKSLNADLDECYEFYRARRIRILASN